MRRCVCDRCGQTIRRLEPVYEVEVRNPFGMQRRYDLCMNCKKTLLREFMKERAAEDVRLQMPAELPEQRPEPPSGGSSQSEE